MELSPNFLDGSWFSAQYLDSDSRRGVDYPLLQPALIHTVVTWEITYFNVLPSFANDYANYMVEKLRAAGATQQAIDAQLQQMSAILVFASVE
ncbi:MAG TPA: hypothetical protein VIV66_00835 [Pyrinomonadaceae bacterium]